MAVRYISAPSNARLWEELTERFLNDVGSAVGPGSRSGFAWLTHRVQRDALYIKAARRGLPGWLAPPIAFFSELPDLFDIRQKRIGLFRRRALIGRLASEHGAEFGIDSKVSERTGIVQALDALFGELLPEGVPPERLDEALDLGDSDEFARGRDAWLVAVYRGYLEVLDSQGVYDPRQIHAKISDRIEAGGLSEALGGATKLHIYGLTSLRSRRRLIAALSAQRAVEVRIYVGPPAEGVVESEFEGDVVVLEGDVAGGIRVQSAPDGRREFEWIACKVKELLTGNACAPHEIAVVARTGRDDTRRAFEILSAAGLPCTARIRSRLSEVPALKALLALFRAAARGWTYRPMRGVLASSYFDLDIDLRSIDYLARKRRVEELERWSVQLRRLNDRLATADDDWEYRREGLFSDRLAKDCAAFDEFRKKVEWLDEPRPLHAWVRQTRRLLKPGLFGFRSQICNGHGGRWEVVRLDQRAVERLDRMLAEWPLLERDDSPDLPVGEWYARLRRFLDSNELALTTPLQTGVQLLEAHEAALFPFKHTFVVHANDGEFPRRPGARPIFSEAERKTLAERGLPLTYREEWYRRERALWRAVTANRNVTLSYRTADPNGAPLLPSLLVPEHDASREIPRTRFTWDTPFNEVQERRNAAARLMEVKRSGGGGPIDVADPGALRHAVLAAHAEAQRREGPPGVGRAAGSLNPWNGLIRDRWVLEYLDRRFGEDRVWSASQLESYAECPFLYLLKRVLRLQELEEAEEETTPLTFGGVAHEALERFYPELLAGTFPAEYDHSVARVFDQIAASVFAEAERDESGWLGIPPLWAVTKRDLQEKLVEYLTWELPRFGDWRPHLFEHEFGGEHGVEIEGHDLDGQPRPLRVRGYIDRVDCRGADENTLYRIVDYKSGGVPAKTHYEHGVVQIPIYMKALAKQLGVRVVSGEYRSIKGCKEAGQAEWGDANFERALKIAFSIPARVRDGQFEPAAASSVRQWPSYWPGLDVVRVKVVLKDRCRFDE